MTAVPYAPGTAGDADDPDHKRKDITTPRVAYCTFIALAYSFQVLIAVRPT